MAGLDGLWAQICSGLDEVHGIKIDVQKMEIKVLRGMTAILQRWQPKLVVEFHAGVNRTTLLDLVKASGYSQKAVPIEPLAVETAPNYVDNRSYAFHVS